MTKDAPRQRLDGVRKLKLPLASALRQKQAQFASSSSNGGDVTSKLSRHRGHSLLPLREFDQQLGLLLGPFADFCRLHCCARSEDRNPISCDCDSGATKANSLHQRLSFEQIHLPRRSGVEISQRLRVVIVPAGHRKFVVRAIVTPRSARSLSAAASPADRDRFAS